MKMIVYFFIIFLYTIQHANASGNFVVADVKSLEAPKSDEIKKTIKILENSQDRDKLLKTLRVMASVREAEEKNEGGLGTYIKPVVQFVGDSVSNILSVGSTAIQSYKAIIGYLEVAQHRADIWTSLIWLSLLIVLGGISEAALKYIFTKRLQTDKNLLDPAEYMRKSYGYSYMALFFPFLFVPFILPFFLKSLAVGYWIMSEWILIYIIRGFLLEKKLPHLLQSHPLDSTEEGKHKNWLFVRLFAGIFVWFLFVCGFNLFLDVNHHQQDHIINIALFFSVPLLVLQLREWQFKNLSHYIQETDDFLTTPKLFSWMIKLCIRYLPWLFLIVGTVYTFKASFVDSQSDQTIGLGCVLSYVILLFFLWGRRQIEHKINRLSVENLIKKDNSLLKSLIRFSLAYLPWFSKVLQGLWHFLFIGSLLTIWNTYFSGFLVGVFSNSLIKIGMNIAIIWGFITIFWLIVDFFVKLHLDPRDAKGNKIKPTVFAKTFGPMLHSMAKWILCAIGIFVSLEFFGFDLKPLVYLMSAFAFALSLGSQSLVKDIINGFFALIDGNIAVGDVVTIGQHSGVVESLSLRALILRHSDGALQRIPFSEVTSIINKSRDYTIVPIDVATSYKTDVGSVYEALTNAANAITSDPVFGKHIIEPLSISGIEKFDESSYHVTATIKIKPDPKGKFSREFNRLLKIQMVSFDIQPPTAFHEPWRSSLT